MNGVMNGEHPLSGIGPSNDANGPVLGATCEMIDLTNEESQCWPFCRSADGVIIDGVRHESVIESVDDVDETSPRAPRTRPLTHLRHRLHGQKDQ